MFFKLKLFAILFCFLKHQADAYRDEKNNGNNNGVDDINDDDDDQEDDELDDEEDIENDDDGELLSSGEEYEEEEENEDGDGDMDADDDIDGEEVGHADDDDDGEEEEEEDYVDEDEDGDEDDNDEYSVDGDPDASKAEPCVSAINEIDELIRQRKLSRGHAGNKQSSNKLKNKGQDEDEGIDGEDDPDEFRKPDCTATGHYRLLQCNSRQCWCVTKYGHELEGSRRSVQMPLNFCDNYNPEKDAILEVEDPKKLASSSSNHSNTNNPAFLAVIAVLVITGLLGSALLGVFVVYRMRKKDEGSYALANNNNNNAPERRSTRSLIFNNNSNNNNNSKDIEQHFNYNMQQPLQQLQQQQEFYA